MLDQKIRFEGGSRCGYVHLGFQVCEVSGSTQGSTEVHNVKWFMATEATRSMRVTRRPRDSGMAEGMGKRENVVVSWLGFVSV